MLHYNNDMRHMSQTDQHKHRIFTCIRDKIRKTTVINFPKVRLSFETVDNYDTEVTERYSEQHRLLLHKTRKRSYYAPVDQTAMFEYALNDLDLRIVYKQGCLLFSWKHWPTRIDPYFINGIE